MKHCRRRWQRWEGIRLGNESKFDENGGGVHLSGKVIEQIEVWWQAIAEIASTGDGGDDRSLISSVCRNSQSFFAELDAIVEDLSSA